MNEPELNEFQKAYNQGVEDCKTAIRNVGDDNWEGAEFTPFFINEIARKCSPYCYHHVPSSKEDAQEIAKKIAFSWFCAYGSAIGDNVPTEVWDNLESRIATALSTAGQQGIESAIRLVEDTRASTTHARTRVFCVWLMAELRALIPSHVSDGWQPIETAPKDGRYILLGRKQVWSTSANSCLAYWADSHQTDFPGWRSDSGREVDTSIYCIWMPIPPPISYLAQTNPKRAHAPYCEQDPDHEGICILPDGEEWKTTRGEPGMRTSGS